MNLTVDRILEKLNYLSDTCFLIRSRAIAGTREWFRADAHYIEQTVNMFAGCGLNRGAA